MYGERANGLNIQAVPFVRITIGCPEPVTSRKSKSVVGSNPCLQKVLVCLRELKHRKMLSAFCDNPMHRICKAADFFFKLFEIKVGAIRWVHSRHRIIS